MARGWMMMAALLLPACGSGAGGDGSADSTRAAAGPPAAAAAGTPADSGAVPAGEAAPAPSARDTGYTPWRPLQMPSEPWMQRGASPRALLTRVRDVVAAQLEEPDASVLPSRLQMEQPDSAVGILVHPDQADDSVRDVEFRLHMRREGAEWAVVAVDRRERCRRGVAAGGLCA